MSDKKAKDPVVETGSGGDKPPADIPGTEAGVMAEFEGTTSFSGYAMGGSKSFDPVAIRAANRMKNTGVKAAMPPHTLVNHGDDPAVHFRLMHFHVNTVKALQNREWEDVRKATGGQRGKELSARGTVEVNCRTLLHGLVECTQGNRVDLAGARRACMLRNEGIVYAFPSTLIPGLKLRMLPFSHIWLQVYRKYVTDKLRDAMGLKATAELSAEASGEVERYLMVMAIVDCVAGTYDTAAADGTTKEVDLSKLSTLELRAWFVKNLMPAADLSARVPSGIEKQREHFMELFRDHNPDVQEAFKDAHEVIRRVTNEELLTYGSDFVAGADFEALGGAHVDPYVASEFVDMQGMDRAELQAAFREYIWPKVDLKERPPASVPAQEAFYRDRYAPFNGHVLDELLASETEIFETPAEMILEKGDGFVAGLAESSGFSG